MSTGRSPPATTAQALAIKPESKKRKLDDQMVKTEEPITPVMVNGLDTALVARLPRAALLDVVLQMLPTSTAIKAIVLDKLTSERLLEEDELEEEEEMVEYVIDDDEADLDATDLEDLSGEEAESSQQSHAADDTGPLAGLTNLAKLIMEIMNSAPAPEGGMPWREFEGIWPPVMGTVEGAIKECMEKSLLVAVNDNNELVVSTMPMAEPGLAD